MSNDKVSLHLRLSCCPSGVSSNGLNYVICLQQVTPLVVWFSKVCGLGLSS